MQTTLPLRPRTSGRFASLMELYERNYMLARLLVPRLRDMDEGEHVSHAPGAMPLVLSRIVHDRYTTTFNLTYRFSSRHRHAREPDLAIRLYHDARTCEVMSGLLPGLRNGPRRTRDLDDGWRLNRFLHRWLGYCLRQGHGFGEAPVTAAADGDANGTGALGKRVADDVAAGSVGDDAVADDAVGEDAVGEDAVGEDVVGEDVVGKERVRGGARMERRRASADAREADVPAQRQ